MKQFDLDNLPMTIRVEDLSPLLGVSRSTAYQLVKSKKFDTIKIGRQTRIPRNAILEYIKKHPLQKAEKKGGIHQHGGHFEKQ